MSMYPENYRYTKDHEWLSVDGGTGTIGITHHAQEELGDIVYVDLPRVGAQLTQGGSMGSVESVKAVSDIYSPASGEVIAINEALANAPEKLFIFTEMGQDAGFPDKEGFLFVDSKRYGWTHYRGNAVERPHPHLYIGETPYVPKEVPYRFQDHVAGVRGVPRIMADDNPNGYVNPVLEWDTNNPIDGIAWSAGGFGADNNLFGAVYGILDTGPESINPTWPAVLSAKC